MSAPCCLCRGCGLKPKPKPDGDGDVVMVMLSVSVRVSLRRQSESEPEPEPEPGPQPHLVEGLCLEEHLLEERHPRDVPPTERLVEGRRRLEGFDHRGRGARVPSAHR